MKVAIMTDMEGVGGVVNFEDYCQPGSVYSQLGKELLTEEINAAVRGFFDAGAEEIMVLDGHGTGGIDITLLDERALYARCGGLSDLFGLDESFDAIAWIGQHAKAGTIGSHITHTGWFDAIDLKVNGVSIGEYGYFALMAADLGIRPVFVSGEMALEQEVKEITPWVHTVSVKRGLSVSDGRNLNFDEYSKANLGVISIHPRRARKLIYEGAYEALLDYKKNPDNFSFFELPRPHIMETWHRRRNDIPEQYIKTEGSGRFVDLFVEHYKKIK